MNEKFELTEFSAGDTKEHEGVTYKAVRQEQDQMCKGCAFHKRGEPCESPRGWVCVEVTEGNMTDLIFKKVE